MKPDRSLIVVYGSYGYTGQLIVDIARRKGLSVHLAGRNEAALKKQSAETGFSFSVVDSSDQKGLEKILTNAGVVIHCGGPFRHTAQTMLDACLATKTHYTDITGEFEVFEALANRSEEAVKAGIMVMPGIGFDVVPSDCLALHLKNRLPGATHLQLAFASTDGGLSRGTRKSMTEGLGYGGFVRKDGRLQQVPLGHRVETINFGAFQTKTVCIPWGDISTAYRSTGIPNIEVYTGATDSMIRNARMSNYLGFILRMKAVKQYMLRQIDKRAPGPSEKKRESGKSFLWGRATDATGKQVESRLVTMSGYKLTAATAVHIAEKILAGNFKVGYQTPSMAYGADLILEMDQTTRTDVA